uniref:Uncharacterized protein n=1 Tax=Romanomermis culicivorax TaxID=13658 RepID=A0A915HY32_ROMCU
MYMAIMAKWNIEDKVLKTRQWVNSLMKATGIGRKHGFRFLMNVHQEEYCVTQNSYHGIGVLFGLKENYAALSFYSEKGFHGLPVGYETGVNIKLTQFVRNTEHLGRCVNKKMADSAGQNPTPYYFGLCTAKAIAQTIYEKCGCISPVKDTFIPYLNPRNFDLTGYPLNYSFEKDCRNVHKYGLCAYVLLQQLLENKLWPRAPYCPLPCRERSFTMTFDRKKLNTNFLVGDRNSTESLIVKKIYNDIAKQAYFHRNNG